MGTNKKEKTANEEQDITGDNLRYLVNQISWWFCGNQEYRRRTRRVLLDLVGEFVKDEHASYELERSTRIKQSIGRKKEIVRHI